MIKIFTSIFIAVSSFFGFSHKSPVTEPTPTVTEQAATPTSAATILPTQSPTGAPSLPPAAKASPACKDYVLRGATLGSVGLREGGRFNISCNYDDAALDCVRAFSDAGKCEWSRWDGKSAIFSCAASSAGVFKSSCGLSPNTPMQCCMRTDNIGNVTVAKAPSVPSSSPTVKPTLIPTPKPTLTPAPTPKPTASATPVPSAASGLAAFNNTVWRVSAAYSAPDPEGPFTQTTADDPTFELSFKNNTYCDSRTADPITNVKPFCEPLSAQADGTYTGSRLAAWGGFIKLNSASPEFYEGGKAYMKYLFVKK